MGTTEQIKCTRCDAIVVEYDTGSLWNHVMARFEPVCDECQNADDGSEYYDERADLREAEELHEHADDDGGECRHACCERLRAEVESLRMAARHVPQVAQSWIFEDGKGGMQ